MNNREQFKKLAEEILKKSKQNLLPWHPGNYTGCYETGLGQGAVVILHNTLSTDFYGNPIDDEDSPPTYSLSFLNQRGDSIGSLDTYIYEKANIPSLDAEFSLLKEIYETAHNSYMMTDETLKSMFEDLLSK